MASPETENVVNELRSTDEAHKRRQRIRSIAIGVALGAVVIMFYLVTIIRLGSGVAQRTM